MLNFTVNPHMQPAPRNLGNFKAIFHKIHSKIEKKSNLMYELYIYHN